MKLTSPFPVMSVTEGGERSCVECACVREKIWLLMHASIAALRNKLIIQVLKLRFAHLIR